MTSDDDKRTSVPCRKGTHRRLRAVKPDDSRWEDFMADVADMIEGEVDPEDVAASDDDVADQLARLRDEINRVPSRAADEVETRLRR